MLLSLLDGKDLCVAPVELFSPAREPSGLLDEAGDSLAHTIKAGFHPLEAAINAIETLIHGVEALVHPLRERGDQMENILGRPLQFLADVAGGAP